MEMNLTTFGGDPTAKETVSLDAKALLIEVLELLGRPWEWDRSEL